MTDGMALFGLGVLGTGHCIGMCGPLVLAFPARRPTRWAHAGYHAGRVATYTAVGAVLGALGGRLSLAMVGRGQVVFSLLAAALLLALGLMRLELMPEPRWMTGLPVIRLPAGLRRRAPAGRRGDGRDMFLAGAVLGLLPCGLSYGAFAKALSAGSAGEGALGTLLFGLGTVPGLLFVGTGASAVARRFRRHSDLLAGMLLIGMGLHLVVTALGSGLPW